MKLSQVIDELVEEKGLDKNLLAQIITDSMLAAYKKKYPDLPIKLIYNKKTDEIETLIEKHIVSSVQDEDAEISLRKAKSLNENVKVGDLVDVPFEKPIGRIEILKAKQIIAQKIRSIESSAVYKEYKPKEGTVVQGTIHKCERNGIVIKVQDHFAFLPKSLSIPSEKCIIGYPLRALLKEVLAEPRNDSQLILDRASADFLKKLFELEIPEVYEKLVEVKKIVRAPGYKSKVLVVSNDKNIDPVGTCIGVSGARIKPILKELGTEKIDVISNSGNLEDLVRDALKPAIVNKIEFEDHKVAKVSLDEDQRAIAIGRHGLNITLASQISGVEIHLNKEEPEENTTEKDREIENAN